MTIAIRVAGPADQSWIVDAARELLGDERQVHTRRQFSVLDGEVLLAEIDGRCVGFVTWDHEHGVAEILAVGTYTRRAGAGRALVDAVRARAADAGCERVVVVTTDENDGAQRFYVATGFALRVRRVGAVDECRVRFKPSIPEGIHDELEYEATIAGTPSRGED
jgi:ribosomal protein S18 acetylase RimI-like enzyme